jgi:hypothetical protein
VLHVATCLWDVNNKSQPFSRCYDESWVEKLYRGFRRNLAVPFRFVVFTDRLRRYHEPIEQELLKTARPDYGCMIEPFRFDEPSIICGLDTVILEPIDHMARYCLEETKIALPAHPSKPHVTINPIVFAPKGHTHVFNAWRGENDMEWLKVQDHVKSDTMWPGQIRSFKLHDVRRRGIQDARIVYFHGAPKMHEIDNQRWLTENWI